MEYIDTHAHLQMEQFEDDIEETINRAIDTNCKGIFVVGYDLKSSADALNLAQKYDIVKAIVGIHPHDAEKELKNNFLKEIENMLSSSNAIAIGEIGLDFYYNWSPKEIQKRVFKDQLDLAADKQVPVVLHIRNAFTETFEITNKYNSNLKFLVHSFTGDKKDAEYITKHNYYYSVNGIITFKNNKIKELIKNMPLNKMLIETDSPYLAPVPKRGKRNEPAFIPFIIEFLSELLNRDKKEISAILLKNTNEFFNVSY